eukprot:comp23572_c0_seq1/m.39919 comp23572_c0_seq1/g.39919  ORF comp23572_c0_seq1/g.39919 comp23572_c0_seq1/m.39919 type:complete len:1067 (-) comp23572_c0_seq1:597-3797(-)
MAHEPSTPLRPRLSSDPRDSYASQRNMSVPGPSRPPPRPSPAHASGREETWESDHGPRSVPASPRHRTPSLAASTSEADLRHNPRPGPRSQQRPQSHTNHASGETPHTGREQLQLLDELRKENFELKARIFYMENKGSDNPSYDAVRKENVDLQVKVETLQRELARETQRLQATQGAVNRMFDHYLAAEQSAGGVTLQFILQELEGLYESAIKALQTDDANIWASDPVSQAAAARHAKRADRQLAERSKEVATLNDTIRALQEENERVTSDLQRVARECEQARNALQDAKDELEGRERRFRLVNDHNVLLADQVRDYDDIKRALDQAHREADHLKQVCQDRDEAAQFWEHSAKRAQQEHHKQLKDLDDQIADMQHQLAAMSKAGQKSDQLQDLVYRLEREGQDLREEALGTQERCRYLQDQLRRVEDDLNAAQQALRQKALAAEDMNRHIDRARALEAQKAALEQEVAGLRGSLYADKENIQKLETVNKAFARQVQELEDKLQDMAGIHRHMADLQGKLALAEDEVGRLRSDRDMQQVELRRLREQADSLVAERRQLESEVRDLAAQRTQLARAKEAADKDKDILVGYRRQAEDLAENMREELEHVQSNFRSVSEELRKARQEGERLRVEVDHREAEGQRTREALQRVTARLQETEDLLEKTRREAGSKEAQLQEAQAACDDLRATMARLEGEKVEERAALDRLTAEAQQLRQQAAASQQTVHEHEATIHTLSTDRDDLQADVEQAEEERARLEATCKELNEQLGSRAHEIEALTAQLEDADRQFNDMADHIRQLQAERQTLEEDYKKASQQGEEMRQDLEVVQRDLAQARAHIDALQADLATAGQADAKTLEELQAARSDLEDAQRELGNRDQLIASLREQLQRNDEFIQEVAHTVETHGLVPQNDAVVVAENQAANQQPAGEGTALLLARCMHYEQLVGSLRTTVATQATELGQMADMLRDRDQRILATLAHVQQLQLRQAAVPKLGTGLDGQELLIHIQVDQKNRKRSTQTLVVGADGHVRTLDGAQGQPPMLAGSDGHFADGAGHQRILRSEELSSMEARGH